MERNISKDELHIILTKAAYWEDVAREDNEETAHTILFHEACIEVSRLGPKILFILKDYAERNYPGANK